MERYQAGEIEAFERLYLRLAPRLRGWLARQRLDLGAELEDLVQETFLQIHRSRHTYSPGRAVEPWAWSIARHVYLMDRRTRNRKQARELHEATGDVGERLAETRSADGASRPDASTASRDLLGRSLTRTTAKRRTSMILHHLWGFSFREIGRMLGVRADTAKRRASRGVADLRESLDHEEEREP